MTAYCIWLAVVCFGIAAVLGWWQPESRTRWAFFVALGLTAYVLPAALTASHIAHS
jgi:hypothetical protein